MKKVKKISKYVFYCILVSLVALCCYVFVCLDILHKNYVDLFGYTYFIVASGSMSGEIEVNDIVFVKISKKVKTNDIIAYVNEEKSIITHRLVQENNGKYICKGDANDSYDKAIGKEAIIGKVVYVLTPKIIMEFVILLAIILVAIALLNFDAIFKKKLKIPEELPKKKEEDIKLEIIDKTKEVVEEEKKEEVKEETKEEEKQEEKKEEKEKKEESDMDRNNNYSVPNYPNNVQVNPNNNYEQNYRQIQEPVSYQAPLQQPIRYPEPDYRNYPTQPQGIPYENYNRNGYYQEPPVYQEPIRYREPYPNQAYYQEPVRYRDPYQQPGYREPVREFREVLPQDIFCSPQERKNFDEHSGLTITIPLDELKELKKMLERQDKFEFQEDEFEEITELDPENNNLKRVAVDKRKQEDNVYGIIDAVLKVKNNSIETTHINKEWQTKYIYIYKLCLILQNENYEQLDKAITDVPFKELFDYDINKVGLYKELRDKIYEMPIYGLLKILFYAILYTDEQFFDGIFKIMKYKILIDKNNTFITVRTRFEKKRLKEVISFMENVARKYNKDESLDLERIRKLYKISNY